MPGLVDFFLFGLTNRVFRHQTLVPNKKNDVVFRNLVNYLEHLREPIRKALRDS